MQIRKEQSFFTNFAKVKTQLSAAQFRQQQQLVQQLQEIRLQQQLQQLWKSCSWNYSSSYNSCSCTRYNSSSKDVSSCSSNSSSNLRRYYNSISWWVWNNNCVKAVATTAAALRKCSKVKEGSLPEHHFLSREEIQLSMLLWNL